jgi:hypothetical protein
MRDKFAHKMDFAFGKVVTLIDHSPFIDFPSYDTLPSADWRLGGVRHPAPPRSL